MDRRVSGFKRSSPVVDLYQVFNKFPNLLEDLPASVTVTGIVQSRRRPTLSQKNVQQTTRFQKMFVNCLRERNTSFK